MISGTASREVGRCDFLALFPRGMLTGAPEEGEVMARDKAAVHAKVRALYKLASAAEAAGDIRGAIRFVRRLQRLRPKSAIFRGQTGWLYRNIGQYARVERDFRRAVALAVKPDDTVICLFGLALVLHNVGSYEEAIGCCCRALTLEPENDELHSLIGQSYQAIGKSEAAEEHFRRAIDLDPSNGAYFRNLADLLRVGKGHCESEVFGLLRHAARLDPLDRRSRMLLAVWFERAGRWAEAGEEYRDIVRRWPDVSEAHWGYGTYLVSQGDQRRGEEHLRKAVDLDPKDGPSLFYLGKYLVRSDRRSEGLACLRRAARRKHAQSRAFLDRLKQEG